MPDRIDWAALEAAYITSNKSYRVLAAENGISATMVSLKGKDGGWPAKRTEYRRINAKKAIEQQSENAVNKLLKLMDAADWLNDTIAAIKKDPEQFNRHLVQDDVQGVTVEKLFDKIDTRAIRDLSGAMKDMVYVTRNLYNLPTQAEAEAQRVAAERLKLEQQKAEKEERDEGAVHLLVLGSEAGKYAQ
jgi:hypothetical protein